MAGMHTDYYAILGVAKDCHPDDIKKAFKAKAKVLHPDKNKADPNAAAVFAKLNTAYKILSDTVLRDLYDSTTATKKEAEPLLSLEGDEMFKAFEYAQDFRKHNTLYQKILPILEEKYERKFRVNTGAPCKVETGGCSLLNLKDMFSFLKEKRVVACTKHHYIHTCDDICTSQDEQCVIFAMCISQPWRRVDLPNIQAHVCTSRSCSFTNCVFDNIYICRESGNVHLCTVNQCDFKKPHQKSGGQMCPVSHKLYNSSNSQATLVSRGNLSSFLHDETSSVRSELEAEHDLSSRKRMLKYTDKNGKEVEVVVDVPWGLNIGEEIDGFEESFGKRNLLKYNESKEEKIRPIITHEQPPTKRRRQTDKDTVFSRNKNNTYFRQNVNLDNGFIGAEYGKSKKRGRYDDSDEEDVYDYVDLGCYGADGGGKLDLRAEDEDYENLGDYATMRGQIGDEEDVVDEFREDEEQKEEREQADLTFRLESAIQREKELLLDFKK